MKKIKKETTTEEVLFFFFFLNTQNCKMNATILQKIKTCLRKQVAFQTMNLLNRRS